MKKHSVDIIVPTCKSTRLVECLIKSFNKFNDDYDLKFYVIENSSFTDDNEYLKSLAPSVIVHNNIVDFSNKPFAGSYYNASGCEVGLKLSSSDIIFFAHNDVAATKSGWLKSLHEKLESGYAAASFLHDNIRINALHISGILTTRSVASSVDLNCRLDAYGGMLLDVGDEITEYCRDNNLKVFCHKNTHNDPDLSKAIKKPYDKINVVRCLDDNDDVVFMHCGRGTPKINGRYFGKGSNIDDWVDFLNSHLELDIKSK